MSLTKDIFCEYVVPRYPIYTPQKKNISKQNMYMCHLCMNLFVKKVNFCFLYLNYVQNEQ